MQKHNRYKCWWHKDHQGDRNAFHATTDPDMPQGFLVIRSDEAKKILGKHLATHDPEYLEWLKAFAGEFGPVAEIVVERDEELFAKLEEMKHGKDGK